MNWYRQVLKKYAVFGGRARRMEYWMFFLFNVIIGFVLMALSVVEGMVIGTPIVSILYLLYTLAVIVPSIAVGIRRLHDTNRSGWWLLIALVPFVGGIILLVILAMDSQPGSNQYGPNPKEGAA